MGNSVSPTNTPTKGTYEVNGYTIRLLSDGGGETKLPFFYAVNTTSRIWIEHNYYLMLKSSDTKICASLPL